MKTPAVPLIPFVIKLALAAVLLGLTSSCRRSKVPDFQLTFNGSSEALKATEIVPTLDTPISRGKNVIWCASFQAAWKALEKDLAGGPIALAGPSDFAEALNQASDPRPSIPEESLYV